MNNSVSNSEWKSIEQPPPVDAGGRERAWRLPWPEFVQSVVQSKLAPAWDDRGNVWFIDFRNVHLVDGQPVQWDSVLRIWKPIPIRTDCRHMWLYWPVTESILEYDGQHWTPAESTASWIKARQ